MNLPNDVSADDLSAGSYLCDDNNTNNMHMWQNEMRYGKQSNGFCFLKLLRLRSHPVSLETRCHIFHSGRSFAALQFLVENRKQFYRINQLLLGIVKF